MFPRQIVPSVQLCFFVVESALLLHCLYTQVSGTESVLGAQPPDVIELLLREEQCDYAQPVDKEQQCIDLDGFCPYIVNITQHKISPADFRMSDFSDKCQPEPTFTSLSDRISIRSSSPPEDAYFLRLYFLSDVVNLQKRSKKPRTDLEGCIFRMAASRAEQ